MRLARGRDCELSKHFLAVVRGEGDFDGLRLHATVLSRILGAHRIRPELQEKHEDDKDSRHCGSVQNLTPEH